MAKQIDDILSTFRTQYYDDLLDAKGKKPKSKRLKSLEEHEDPEIQAEIDKGNTVNILYDSH
jgi:hypothetical protein